MYHLYVRVLHKTRPSRINDLRFIFDTCALIVQVLFRTRNRLYKEVDVLFRMRTKLRTGETSAPR